MKRIGFTKTNFQFRQAYEQIDTYTEKIEWCEIRKNGMMWNEENWNYENEFRIFDVRTNRCVYEKIRESDIGHTKWTLTNNFGCTNEFPLNLHQFAKSTVDRQRHLTPSSRSTSSRPSVHRSIDPSMGVKRCFKIVEPCMRIRMVRKSSKSELSRGVSKTISGPSF